MSKANKRLDSMDTVRITLWVDPDDAGIYWDQPPGDRVGYRKRRKYTEADKKRLEQNIGEDVIVIRPGGKFCASDCGGFRIDGK